MERVNARVGALPDADTKIADFWEAAIRPPELVSGIL
jgi:hypothetical protein